MSAWTNGDACVNEQPALLIPNSFRMFDLNGVWSVIKENFVGRSASDAGTDADEAILTQLGYKKVCDSQMNIWRQIVSKMQKNSHANISDSL